METVLVVLVALMITVTCVRVIKALNKSYQGEMTEFKDFLLRDLLNQKNKLVQEADSMIHVRARELESLKLAAQEEVALQQHQLDLAIEAKKKLIVAEYKRLDDHFRNSLGDDVTLKLLAAAYTLASSGTVPKNEVGSAFVNAVLAHEREGGPNLQKPLETNITTKLN